MYCPQCSQQQVSEEMRFCSRCGFPLTGVRELIASDALTPDTKNKRPPSVRGVRQATWIMLGGVLLSLFVALLTAAEDDFVVLLMLPAACYIIGFIRLLYAVFIQDRAELKQKELMVTIQSAISRHPARELVAPREPAVNTFARPDRKTAEVVQPPSVTEQTTRFLDDEPKRR
jgi:hypothetical protein